MTLQDQPVMMIITLPDLKRTLKDPKRTPTGPQRTLKDPRRLNL